MGYFFMDMNREFPCPILSFWGWNIYIYLKFQSKLIRIKTKNTLVITCDKFNSWGKKCLVNGYNI